jgi:3-phenylpropionate/trans-cinnamate dioxygenase ferredoxin subunit
MTQWIDAAREGSLAPGEHLLIEIDGDEVALFHVDGEYFAIQDVCSHDGTEIASGQLEGCEIVCPRHGARFCLKTGKVLAPPAYEDITTYPVRLRAGRIEISNEPNP